MATRSPDGIPCACEACERGELAQHRRSPVRRSDRLGGQETIRKRQKALARGGGQGAFGLQRQATRSAAYVAAISQTLRRTAGYASAQARGVPGNFGRPRRTRTRRSSRSSSKSALKLAAPGSAVLTGAAPCRVPPPPSLNAESSTERQPGTGEPSCAAARSRPAVGRRSRLRKSRVRRDAPA